MLAAGAHMLWQVKKLDIDNAENCLAVFPVQPRHGCVDRHGVPGGELVRLEKL